MNITVLRSDEIYKKIINAKNEDKENIYRYELMKPFEYKWQCIGVPLEAQNDGGYDVISASTMGGGYHPAQITEKMLKEVDKISEESFWDNCVKSIRNTLEGFERNGIILLIQNYIFTVLLNDPHNPMSTMTGDYCGDGGIPGYIFGTIIPNETSIKMLPVALAHEANHNVRWQFMKWSSEISLADMIISEGLAESFAAYMYGKDKVGKWVKDTTDDMLHDIIKPLIKENLYEKDFNKLSLYLYGDDIMAMRGIEPAGIPYCAGYACGYALIQHYLNKTGKSIYEATITSTEDILRETEDFWS
ncbi:DUF2268 domain-containing protein [Anaeromicropila herbilytica]|uniref:DUF2268 domain-containing protein n=1 Tax=Anaeromicropila herbilytica TaxID=2785025 RepID=A0A7R7IDJ7_9FIRM|nr:DUF2268 domain-containing protein [Anaeromicropila herbilytica]BCN31627.1 hypothetical protein bsdtb5_29220 [Anaeromicropila herbilytica]